MSLSDSFRAKPRFPLAQDGSPVLPTLSLGSGKMILADEGDYFVAINPTPGTAIAFAITAAVSETAGYFLSVFNQDGAKKLYLDYLRLICAVVPASATAGEMFIKTDTTGFSSGGSPITPANVNGEITAPSVASVNAGALTTAARSANARLLTRAKLRTAIPVAGDEWNFVFGCQEFGAAGPTGGANALRMPVGLPPVIVAPKNFALFQLWFPGNITTAAQFEFELGYMER